MSLGNSKNAGNDGNNYPYQYANLKLSKTANTVLVAILAALGGTPTPPTPYGPLRETGAGTVPIAAKSVSFYNAGDADASVNGEVLKSGEQVTWDGGSTGLATSIAYDGSGTELVINYTL